MDKYSEILDRMISKYEQLAGVALNNESDIMLRLKVLAGEIYNNTVAAQFLKQQMFALTATGSFLDKHAQTRGLSRKAAQKAYGEVTFSLEAAQQQNIVIDKGTVVATSTADAKSFVTNETVTLEAGELSVTVPVTAAVEGADHNVLSNTVTVMVTPPLYVSSVTNNNAFSGGVDAESDEELRARVLDSYRDISNSTNAIYYKQLAQSVPGVYSASVVPCVRGAGTVDVYICGKGSAQINDAHISDVQSLMDENRELNVDVLVKKASPYTVSYIYYLEVLESYEFDEVAAVIEQKIIDYIDSLGVAKPALLCDIGDLIYHTDGVKNYSFVDTFCSDVYTEKNEYCVVDKINVRQVS